MEIMTIPILSGQLPKFLGAVCYEGDKNVRRLEFTGAEPELQYKLDLERSDGVKNVVDLENQNGTLVLTMDDSVSIPAGRYQVQLRTVGDVVRHSNKAFLTVRDSINAIDAFSEVQPTEMAQMELRMTATAKHPPIPGKDGTWLLWDAAASAYQKSTLPVQEEHPVFVAKYGITSFDAVLEAWNAGKAIFCRAGDAFSAMYRHKANTYFSFKMASTTQIETRFCRPGGWDMRQEDILADLAKRVAALEAKV